MLNYFVPQIQHKLKLIGPFGFKEFIILGVCLLCSVILFYIVEFIFVVLFSIVIFGIALTFIFTKVNGLPLEKYFKYRFLFIFSQKNYFWRRDQSISQDVRVISKQKEKEKERLYRVVRSGALSVLSNQINLGVEVGELSQKTERAWKELLKLDEPETKQADVELLEKKKKFAEMQKATTAELKKIKEREMRLKLKKAHKDIERVGKKRLAREERRQQIEERLRLWAERKKAHQRTLKEIDDQITIVKEELIERDEEPTVFLQKDAQYQPQLQSQPHKFIGLKKFLPTQEEIAVIKPKEKQEEDTQTKLKKVYKEIETIEKERIEKKQQGRQYIADKLRTWTELKKARQPTLEESDDQATIRKEKARRAEEVDFITTKEEPILRQDEDELNRILKGLEELREKRKVKKTREQEVEERLLRRIVEDEQKRKNNE